MTRKEIAKFFSGFAASQPLSHGALAVAGVQFTIFGISYTPGFNTLAAVAWVIVLVVLVRCMGQQVT